MKTFTCIDSSRCAVKLKCCENIFTNRTHQAKVDSCLSDTVELISVTVQGSGIVFINAFMKLFYLRLFCLLQLCTAYRDHIAIGLCIYKLAMLV